MPVTAAPASADERNDRTGTGLCCAPNVPGRAPDGSTLLVRQRIATGASDWNRSAPADPTGSASRPPRTSMTSRIFPAASVNDAVAGDGFAFPAAWNDTLTRASPLVGL